MLLEIFSDTPWSHIGKRRLERAWRLRRSLGCCAREEDMQKSVA